MILVFGASGSLGVCICQYFEDKGLDIIRVSTSKREGFITVTLDDVSELSQFTHRVEGVVYAHGQNLNDSLENFNFPDYQDLVNANCGYILQTMSYLQENNCLVKGSNVCIISSIWQEFTRKNKLSYTISKAAVGGLVRSLAADLSSSGILVNAVLPGVIGNEMTLKTLTSEQIHKVENATDFKRLVSLEDVTSLVNYLINENTGITGQSIKVDLGFTTVKSYN